MLNIAVLVSGGGTNLQALIDAEKRGEIPDGRLQLVIASNPDAYALTRARQHGIEAITVNKKSFISQQDFERTLITELTGRGIDLIVLAGFMCILSQNFTNHFNRKIINVHPSLIPAFCGEGYYGLRVHKAALDCGVKLTGATVHFVNEIPDGGQIILQQAVAVQPGDTPELLQKRVMQEAEWHILPKAVAMFCSGAIR